MKKNQEAERANSDLHPHNFLVAFDEIVADFDHQRKGRTGLLHGDHCLVKIVGFAGQHLGLFGGGALHFAIDFGDGAFEDIAEGTFGGRLGKVGARDAIGGGEGGGQFASGSGFA